MIKSPRANLLELGVGLAAAGAGAVLGLAAERLAVGRPLVGKLPVSRARQLPDETALGSLRSVPVTVTSDDGTDLYVEIDEPDEPDPDGLTVVFSHGYCLNLDSWHYQRLAMRGTVRMVFWDQRGHGRSQRGAPGSASLHQLGADLERVIDETVPTGPMVLVGHSMGGMTVMSLAARQPTLFQDRVVACALIATSSGGLDTHDLGLDALGRLVMKLAPSAVELVAKRPGWVERGRRIGSDLEEVIVKRWSYASKVSPELLDFTARMIAATRIEVVSEFMSTLAIQEGHWALEALEPLDVVVIAGDKDLMIPPQHSERIAELLPRADLVIVKNGNHLVMLEHPDVVTPHLIALVAKARRSLKDGGRRAAPTAGRQSGAGRGKETA